MTLEPSRRRLMQTDMENDFLSVTLALRSSMSQVYSKLFTGLERPTPPLITLSLDTMRLEAKCGKVGGLAKPLRT